jgi:hypothetical protein
MPNAVTDFEVSLATTSLSLGQQAEVKVLSDKMASDLWIHFCDHEIKHLNSIALADPLNAETQRRVTTLKDVVTDMRVNGMPDVTTLEVL